MFTLAASNDIVIAAIADIGSASPQPLPASPQGPGTFRAPVVTFVVEPGQRVLAFLARVIDGGLPVTHGVLDYLLIEPGGRLRSMSGSPGTTVAPAAIGRAGGAAFLDGAMLDQVAAEIVAIRPAG